MTVEQSDLLNIYKTRVAYLEGQLKANFEVVNSLMSAQVRKSFCETQVLIEQSIPSFSELYTQQNKKQKGDN